MSTINVTTTPITVTVTKPSNSTVSVTNTPINQTIQTSGVTNLINSTTDLAEGSNLYFTNTRARGAISGGAGVSYDNTTGIITATGSYTDAQARSAISAGTGISYNSTTGAITNTVTQYTDAFAKSALSAGTGIGYNSATGVISSSITQYTDALARAAISAGTGISYNSTTGAITNTVTQYTDTLARAAISAGTGVTYNSTTGQISIGQAVNTNSDVTFNSLAINATVGSNLINNRNYVKGAIRNSTAQSSGDVWNALAGAGVGTTGFSIDNSIDTTKRPGGVIRAYGAGLASGAPVGQMVFEAAKGSAASPTNIANGSILGQISFSGYTNSGWATDISGAGAPPGVLRFAATEDWTNGANNVGTRFMALTAPKATALTSTSLQVSLSVTAEQSFVRTDDFLLLDKTNASGYLEVIKDDGSGHPMLSLNKLNATNGYQFPVVNFTSQKNSGSGFTPTQTGDILGAFKFNGNAYSGSSAGVPGGPGAQISCVATENWTSTANGSSFLFTAQRKGALGDVAVIQGASDQTTFASDHFTFNDSNNNTKLTIDGATGVTEAATLHATNMMHMPVYTSSGLTAITGAVGWMASVSNAGGRMAYWDTTNSRWSYVCDNTAV